MNFNVVIRDEFEENRFISYWRKIMEAMTKICWKNRYKSIVVYEIDLAGFQPELLFNVFLWKSSYFWLLCQKNGGF